MNRAPRNHTLGVRLNDAELELITKAANKNMQAPSEWLRNLGLMRGRMEIEHKTASDLVPTGRVNKDD
jgi:hypothetical protein